MSNLAIQLKRIREFRGLTLREVEKRTGISNAYLSQLERDEASNPAPRKLAELAECYEVPYESLMEAAGYIDRSMFASGPDRVSQTAFQSALLNADLNSDEEQMVADFISNVLRKARGDSAR